MDERSQNITRLLLDWRTGDGFALNQLIPLVQTELKRLARNYVRRQRVGHTVQTTALVNEAFIRLVDWTLDGRITYDAYENNRLSIWIADSDGKNATQFTPADSDNSETKVSGDGRFIALTSRRAGFNRVAVIRQKTTTDAVLLSTAGNAAN